MKGMNRICLCAALVSAVVIGGLALNCSTALAGPGCNNQAAPQQAQPAAQVSLAAPVQPRNVLAQTDPNQLGDVISKVVSGLQQNRQSQQRVALVEPRQVATCSGGTCNSGGSGANGGNGRGGFLAKLLAPKNANEQITRTTTRTQFAAAR